MKNVGAELIPISTNITIPMKKYYKKIIPLSSPPNSSLNPFSYQEKEKKIQNLQASYNL